MRIIFLICCTCISSVAGAQHLGFWGLHFGTSKDSVKYYIQKEHKLSPINETGNQVFYAPETFAGFQPDETVLQFAEDKMVIGYADYTVDKANLNTTFRKLKDFVKKAMGKPVVDMEKQSGDDLVARLDKGDKVLDTYVFKDKEDNDLKTLVFFKAGVTNGIYFVTLQYEDMAYYQSTQHKGEGS